MSSIKRLTTGLLATVTICGAMATIVAPKAQAVEGINISPIYSQCPECDTIFCAIPSPDCSENISSCGVEDFEISQVIAESPTARAVDAAALRFETRDIWNGEKALVLPGAPGGSSIDNNFRSISLIVMSRVRGRIAVNTVAFTRRTADKIGLRSMHLQRYQYGRWVTVAGCSSDYDLDTCRYNYARTFNGLVSGATYRVVANYYMRDGSRTRTLTRTSGALICR